MTLLVKDDSIRIEMLSLGPYGTNGYIVTCPGTRSSVVVDAPAEAQKILACLEGTSPQYILMTHNHMDHLGALPELSSKLGVPVAAHPDDAEKLTARADKLLGDGDILSVGNLELKVLHTPGHTPGSLCFLTGEYLLSGDTIFPGGPGKTGSPAKLKQIIESITSKIFPLPDNTQIFSGHGDSTILKKEKEAFALFSSRPHDPNLCGDVLWLSA